MIEIRTGLPGNGKTLSMVQEMAQWLQRWEKHPEEARPIFTNITGLALPYAPIPCREILQGNGAKTYAIQWDEMPDGSIVIADEAQQFFPPRSSQSAAPPHIAFLNTHRHKGLDIYAITQHPKLIDMAVRALAGKHKHYRRVFGMSRSIVYEWDGCSDSLSGMKNAVTSYWSFPKDSFKWYKSAEIHTKQKFKLPLWLGIPLIGLALGLYFVPRAYSVIKNGTQGKTLSEHSAVPSTPSPSVGQLAQGGPVGGAIAPTAGPSPQSPVVAAPGPSYVGCIASAAKVVCLTADGRVEDDPKGGREAAERVGTLVRYALNHEREKTIAPPGQTSASSDLRSSSAAEPTPQGQRIRGEIGTAKG